MTTDAVSNRLSSVMIVSLRLKFREGGNTPLLVNRLVGTVVEKAIVHSSMHVSSRRNALRVEIKFVIASFLLWKSESSSYTFNSEW